MLSCVANAVKNARLNVTDGSCVHSLLSGSNVSTYQNFKRIFNIPKLSRFKTWFIKARRGGLKLSPSFKTLNYPHVPACMLPSNGVMRGIVITEKK